MASKKDEPVLEGGAVNPDALLLALQKSGMEVTAAQDASQVVGYLHTGNYGLNYIISGRFRRGLPLGHVTELFSMPGVGKTYLLLWFIANAQAAGGGALLDDVERRVNMLWAERALKVRTKALPYKHSETVEEHRREVGRFIKLIRDLGVKKPCVIGLDSMALLSTEAELEKFDKLVKESEDAPDSKLKETRDLSRGQEVKKLFRILAHDMADLPVAYVVVNHQTTQFDAFARPDSGGGTGTKFQASVRIGLQQSTRVKASDGVDFLGVKVNAFVEKNSISAPWKSSWFFIPHNSPPNPASGLIPLLLKLGVIEVSGTNIVVNGEDTGLKVHKSAESFLKQDQSGLELLEMYPDLLEWADQVLAEREDALWGKTSRDTGTNE